GRCGAGGDRQRLEAVRLPGRYVGPPADRAVPVLGHRNRDVTRDDRALCRALERELAEVVGLLAAVVVAGPVLYLDVRAGHGLVGAGLLDRSADLHDGVLLLRRALQRDALALGDRVAAALRVGTDRDRAGLLLTGRHVRVLRGNQRHAVLLRLAVVESVDELAGAAAVAT